MYKTFREIWTYLNKEYTTYLLTYYVVFAITTSRFYSYVAPPWYVTGDRRRRQTPATVTTMPPTGPVIAAAAALMAVMVILSNDCESERNFVITACHSRTNRIGTNGYNRTTSERIVYPSDSSFICAICRHVSEGIGIT